MLTTCAEECKYCDGAFGLPSTIALVKGAMGANCTHCVANRLKLLSAMCASTRNVLLWHCGIHTSAQVTLMSHLRCSVCAVAELKYYAKCMLCLTWLGAPEYN